MMMNLCRNYLGFDFFKNKKTNAAIVRIMNLECSKYGLAVENSDLCQKFSG